MVQIELRGMQVKDVVDVAYIDQLCNVSAWTEPLFLQELELPYSIHLVALVEHKIVGFVIAWALHDILQILELAVDPSFRRQGIASKLLVELFDIARQKQCKTAELELRENNAIARQLYRNLGFKAVGKRAQFYHNPDGSRTDAILMNYTICH